MDLDREYLPSVKLRQGEKQLTFNVEDMMVSINRAGVVVVIIVK
jgi:hypothetical protein